MITNLKTAIDSTKGLSYIVEQMNILSAVGRRYLYAETWSNDVEILNETYDLIQRTAEYIDDLDNKKRNDVLHLISQVRDIERTIDGLMNGTILTDIEFFEIKSFSLICMRLKAIINEWDLPKIPSLEQVIVLLDPEKTRVAAFHIYSLYDDGLAELRQRLKQADDTEKTELYQQTLVIEDALRKNLATQLRPLASYIRTTLRNIALLDIMIAKAALAKEMGLARPMIVVDTTKYNGLFNPEIKQALSESGKTFQPISIDFAQYPTLITGINMGGKTVVLKTLCLAQMLCQFGFYVPAESAEIALVSEVLLSIEDKQDELNGLSSFASEMSQINDIILSVKSGRKILVLIDELARTTNPAEGRAIVEAMLDFLQEKEVRSFITTHYDRIQSPCKRLRVKGLKSLDEDIDIKHIGRYIDYTLVEDNGDSVPHEALNIARLLGVDAQFINNAERYLKGLRGNAS